VWTTTFCAFLVSVGYLFVPLAWGQTIPTRIPMMNIADKKIVPVSINGTGPYNFLLDTGSNVTLVDRRLLRQLKISVTDPVTIVTVLGQTSKQRGLWAESVSIVGLSVQHVALNTFADLQVVRLQGGVQGILGENFLEHFDLLFDNDQQTLTLDPGSSLAASLAGEHLQLSRFGNFNNAPIPDRLVVELKVPSYLQKPLLFLVDSGTNTAVLYPGQGGLAIRAMQASQRADLTGKFRGIDLATCEGLTRNKMDTDGVLPTRIFRQFFISYKAGYVIANPHPVDNAGTR
jgi:hypothetical protein